MARLTLNELVRVLTARSTVYRQPGAVFMHGGFYCVHSSAMVAGKVLSVFKKPTLTPGDVSDLLDRTLAVIKLAALTKHKATADLSGATDDELESFVWVAANCRIHHRAQARAIARIGMKLVDCAE